MQAGRLKAIAVTSPTRDADLPNVQTAREAGFPDLETSGWQGLVGPAGMPREVVQKIHGALRATLAKPDVRERLNQLGIAATPGTPEKFGDEIRRDLGRYGPVVKAAGIKAE